MASGDLITRKYSNFRGVDFSNKEVEIYRSPDALNMWKNYKNSLGRCIETRPDIELFKTLDNDIYGLFFYTINNIEHMIIHCGVSLYDYNMETEELKTIKETGMKPAKSQSFIYANIFYIKDGLNYLEYDGEICKEVEGFMPRTYSNSDPKGGGATYQDFNLLTGKRENSFCADGETTQYILDTQELDSVDKVIVDGKETTEYTVDKVNGTVTFSTAPEVPSSDGTANVFIQFTKVIPGARDKINKCTLLEVFDNRVFFSGNQDYPNTIFHSSLENPRYVADLDYYVEGLDMSAVKTMIAGNNAIRAFKEPSQANTSIFYHNPSIDSEAGKVYPSVHSSISTGCVGAGINFNDDICFFSDRGMEAINGDVTTEQVIAHRSSLIDSKLINDPDYKNMILQEYEGYLFVFVGNKVFLADSRAKYTNTDHFEYEWFYWELSKKITFVTVKDNVMYLCSNNEIYTLTAVPTDLQSYWTTPEDEFKYPQMQKTTNKRGCVADITGEKVLVSVKTDNNEFEDINEYINAKGYIVPRIKRKKWKSIQVKFSSKKPFGLFECTLESFIGSYIKR